MKIRWMMLSVVVVCASASAQAQNPPQTQGAGAPAVQTPAKNTAPSQAPAKPAEPASAAPVQGTVVEDIVARVNDDIITTVDYQEALANAPRKHRTNAKVAQRINLGPRRKRSEKCSSRPD